MIDHCASTSSLRVNSVASPRIASRISRNDEVDAQWSIIDPILQAWHAGKPPLAEYEAGTPGPAAADALIGEGRYWRQ